MIANGRLLMVVVGMLIKCSRCWLMQQLIATMAIDYNVAYHSCNRLLYQLQPLVVCFMIILLKQYLMVTNLITTIKYVGQYSNMSQCDVVMSSAM